MNGDAVSEVRRGREKKGLGRGGRRKTKHDGGIWVSARGGF